MDRHVAASKIIDGFLCRPREGVDLDFVREANDARREGRWADALQYCDAAQKLHFGVDDDVCYWPATISLCRGTILQAQGQIKEAIAQYQSAYQNFGLSDEHGAAVALMALGLACRACYENATAQNYFKRSYEAFLELLATSRDRRNPALVRIYENLISQVREQLAELRKIEAVTSQRYPSKRLMEVATAFAGEALYSPDADVETNEIEIGRALWKLISLEDGKQREFSLRADDEYLVTHVKGDSMIGAGIHDGDRILTRRQARVDNGEIAVVRLDTEYGSSTLVKCVKTAPRRIILESANPAYPPREFDAESPAVTVLGKVVAILRRD